MKLDIIWNISLICPWDCEFCCTDAAHVKSSNNDIIISDQSFSRNTTVKIETGTIFKNRYPNIKPSKFDLALIDRQSKGIEPSFQEKVRILKNLKGNDVTIDFAGGDPLACYENYLVIKEAARYFGKDNISITSTGHSLSKYNIYDIANIIGEFEFTYDEPSSVKDSTRPTGYNNSNIQIAKKFSSLGIRTKAQIPIHENNHRHEEVAEIYTTLDNANVNEILIMRTFPVGRGSKFLKKKPITKENIKETIKFFRLCESKGNTSVRLQCALKNLDPSTKINPCDMVSKSFGINFQGLLLLSAWANNDKGLPLSDDFILGDLKNISFLEISKSKKFITTKKRLDENKGHCKIFSYTNGGRTFESIFTKTDPLYT